MNVEDNHKINFNFIKDFPKNIIDEISSILEPLSLEKSEYFVTRNDRMNKIGILLQGTLVSRISSDEGLEIASKFYFPEDDNLVVDFNSFRNQLNSEESIQAVEHCKLLTINFTNYNSILSKHPSIQELAIGLLEENYLKALSRIRDFQFLDARKRVEKFLHTHEPILNKVMIKDKASYLGMSRNIYVKHKKKNN